MGPSFHIGFSFKIQSIWCPWSWKYSWESYSTSTACKLCSSAFSSQGTRAWLNSYTPICTDLIGWLFLLRVLQQEPCQEIIQQNSDQCCNLCNMRIIESMSCWTKHQKLACISYTFISSAYQTGAYSGITIIVQIKRYIYSLLPYFLCILHFLVLICSPSAILTSVCLFFCAFSFLSCRWFFSRWNW